MGRGRPAAPLPGPEPRHSWTVPGRNGLDRLEGSCPLGPVLDWTEVAAAPLTLALAISLSPPTRERARRPVRRVTTESSSHPRRCRSIDPIAVVGSVVAGEFMAVSDGWMLTLHVWSSAVSCCRFFFWFLVVSILFDRSEHLSVFVIALPAGPSWIGLNPFLHVWIYTQCD